MKKLLLLLALVFIASITSGGTITGRFIFLCEAPPASVRGIAIIANIGLLASGDFSSVPTGVTDDSWGFSVSSTFYDDTAYYAMGVVLLSDIAPGNPMGMYPGNPFFTSGGSATGIEIVLDDTVDLPVVVHVIDAPLTNIYLNVYDALIPFLTGAPLSEDNIERTVPVTDTLVVLENVPSGPKYLQVFLDQNSNALWDSMEPNVFAETPETNLVFAMGGVYNTVRIVFNPARIANRIPENTTASLHVSPSPFNDALKIDFQGPDDEYFLTICDISGKIVHQTRLSGCEQIVWHPENMPAGIYMVNIRGKNAHICQRALYAK